MSGFVLPTAAAVKDMLVAIFGDNVVVNADSDAAVDGRHVATYIGDTNELVAACACDDEFVVFSGAALSMVPANVANQMVKERDFTDTVLANFHEVMNICSRLLMTDSTPHLRLDKTLDPSSGNTAVSELGADGKAAAFSIDIPEYGSGKVAFLIA